MSEIEGGASEEERAEAEKFNIESEARDINEMVDEGLLSRSEAGKFDYEKEFEIPKALLSAPPKVSERLRRHVIGKFPQESFQPENIAYTLVHGTSIEAIRPLWLGEANIRTKEGRRREDGDIYYAQTLKKGEFRVHGDWTRLDEKGFFYRIHPSEHREPGTFMSLQIFLVGEKSHYQPKSGGLEYRESSMSIQNLM